MSASRAWTKEQMQQVFDGVKNWGRWGPDDERGALNLITSEKLREGAAAILTGETVSCARELPVQPDAENPNPALHMMIRAGDDCVFPGIGFESVMDFVGVAFHGMATTHMDALCHVFVDGQMYNGFSKDEVKSTGARRGSIMVMADGVSSRGVLLDVPRVLGETWLEPGFAITPGHLEQAEAAQNVTVTEGDILLVSTGRDARRAAVGPWSPVEVGLAGLHHECIPWLHARGVAILGSDGVSDVLPPANGAIEGWAMPIHQATLVAMGVHLLDNLRLDRLGDACARLGRWAFQLNVAPLRVTGAAGSPVNPIAVL